MIKLILSLFTTGKASFALHLISLGGSHPTFTEKRLKCFPYQWLRQTSRFALQVERKQATGKHPRRLRLAHNDDQAGKLTQEQTYARARKNGKNAGLTTKHGKNASLRGDFAIAF